MSILLYFLKAWTIGIAIAAPVGPIGMLCIKKALEIGLKGALLVGLGAALADGTYGIIAGVGLSAVSHTLLHNTHIIKFVGGVLLLYLAYKEARSVGSGNVVRIKDKYWFMQVGEVFLLTIANPMTILSFIGIFASISNGPASISETIIMVIGIFIGSMTWWCILGYVIVKIKHKLPDSWLMRIKWLSCFILGGFGMIAVIGGLMS